MEVLNHAFTHIDTAYTSQLEGARFVRAAVATIVVEGGERGETQQVAAAFITLTLVIIEGQNKRRARPLGRRIRAAKESVRPPAPVLGVW